MLVIKAYVANSHSERQIDEIHIQRGKCTKESLQEYEYKIRQPVGFEKFSIFHIRDLGWKSLMAQAIDVIERVAPYQKSLEGKFDEFGRDKEKLIKEDLERLLQGEKNES